MSSTYDNTYGSAEGGYDADFEIIDDGFEDGEGETVTLGVPQPSNTLLSLYDDVNAVHIVSLSEDDTRKPYEVLMQLVGMCEGHGDLLDQLGVTVVRGSRHEQGGS